MYHEMIITISKGQQITIPAKFRKELGLTAGTRVELQKKGNKLLIIPLGEDMETLFKKADRIKPKKRVTAKQMKELIRREIY